MPLAALPWVQTLPSNPGSHLARRGAHRYLINPRRGPEGEGRRTRLKAVGDAGDELMRTPQPLYSATLAIVLLVIIAALVVAVVLLTRAPPF